MITIENDGPAIVRTDYWQTEHAQRGLVYLSGNAGVLRLLLPAAVEHMLVEMRGATRATIEPSIQTAGCWDVVFEDGTSSPFAIAVDPRQIDRALDRGRTRLVVWTETGQQLDLDCLVRTDAR